MKGKTEIVKQVAKEKGYEVIDLSHPQMSDEAKGIADRATVKTIRDAMGDEVNAGDRVFVSWCARRHQGNGDTRAWGRFLGSDEYGGITVEFDEPIGVEYRDRIVKRRIHYICSLGRIPYEKRRTYLDGFPCIVGRRFIVLEKNKERFYEGEKIR